MPTSPDPIPTREYAVQYAERGSNRWGFIPGAVWPTEADAKYDAYLLRSNQSEYKYRVIPIPSLPFEQEA